MAAAVNNMSYTMKFQNYYFVNVFILIFLFGCKTVFPQISLSTKLDSYYDDNIYNNFTKVSDYVNSFTFSSGYDFESTSNNLQFYYIGNLSYYRENIFKSSNSHKLGAVNTYLFSENDNPLNVGVNYSFRNNKDEFSIYDFSIISLYANYRQTIETQNFLLAGYLFNKIDYKNFSIFSYNENKGFLKFNSYLSENTALMLGVEIDNKNYIDKFSDPSITNNNTQLTGYSQLTFYSGESTELSGYFLLRHNLTTGTRYIDSEEFIYYEEEIFNDVYSNDGYESGISISQFISAGIMMSVQGIYIKRNFSNLPISDPAGFSLNELRTDKFYALGTDLKFDLSFITDNLIGSVKYNFLKNNSNDYYYNYDNQMISVSLEWGL